MPERQSTDPEAGVTVELAGSQPQGRLPAGRDDFRDHLPGIEPDRRVTDWGRSERIEGVVDRTVYEFFFRYWFRVEVDGIENVPADGGALLVANRSGAVPCDGAMIAKALTEEHPRPRSLHLCTDQRLQGWPALGMLATKLGAVTAHPANLHRLLFDEQALVLQFPEGRAGASKPVKERYRLRGFGDCEFVQSAMRARVPIVPVAVLGAEEASPVLLRLRPPARLVRARHVPVVPAFPLPAKFRLRFLEPVATGELGEAPWRDQGLVRALGEDIRALIQENLLEMVGERRSVWLG